MTPLSKTVTRKVCSAMHGDLVVTLAHEGIYFREPRHRTRFLLPYGVAFQRAAFLHVEADRRERRAAKKLRKRGAR